MIHNDRYNKMIYVKNDKITGLLNYNHRYILTQKIFRLNHLINLSLTITYSLAQK